MTTETHVELDWATMDSAPGADASAGSGAGVSPAVSHAGAGAAYLSDEEILGIETVAMGDGGTKNLRRDSSGTNRPQNDNAEWDLTAVAAATPELAHGKTTQAEARATSGQAQAYPTEMPSWMAAAAADPSHGTEAAALWRAHQEFRAAFASPEDARVAAEETRAIRELLPGGVRDVLSLREATQSVERIDAALFSGDARAQAEVVAEIARANPAAFRSLFAEAAKFLAEGGREAGDRSTASPVILSEAKNLSDGIALGDENRQRDSSGTNRPQNDKSPGFGVTGEHGDRGGHGRHRGGHPPGGRPGQNPRPGGEAGGGAGLGDPPDMAGGSVAAGQGAAFRSPLIGKGRVPANDDPRMNSERRDASSLEQPASNLQDFDPAAYATFERATNDAVARDVRASIGETLSRVMPDGVAEGAARRIGEDIFSEVHRAMAADRGLSEQVAGVLSGRRFGAAEQQRVAALLAARAKQLVPGVARRVIGEWTSSVLSTARAKSARQAAAASRVDIGTPGGSRDAMPLRAMNAREVDYASMSDEQILGM